MDLFAQGCFAQTLQKRRGKNEGLQIFIFAGQYLILGAAPFESTFVQEANIVANFHHRVHVVGIYDCGDVVFLGDGADELVDEDGCFRVEAGVGLVTEQVFGI